MRLGGVILSLAVLAAAVPAHAAARPAHLAFDVFRNGDPMGTHTLAFERVGEETRVTVDVDLRVKVGPFTVFRYRHDVRERWRGDELVQLVSETLKDGNEFGLTVGTVGNGLRVDGRDYQGEAPAGLVPTTWWNAAILTQEQALNTETGAILPITVEPLGRETIEAAGETIEAERYRVTATLTVDLWYDDTGRWVKCAFETRGSSIEYVLASSASEA